MTCMKEKFQVGFEGMAEWECVEVSPHREITGSAPKQKQHNGLWEEWAGLLFVYLFTYYLYLFHLLSSFTDA